MQLINTNLNLFKTENDVNLKAIDSKFLSISNELISINTNIGLYNTQLQNLLTNNFESLLINQQKIINRLPISGFSDGITFTLTNPFSSETVIAAIVNLSSAIGTPRSYIQKYTANIIADIKADRYKIYKGTVANITSIPVWTQINGGFIYYTNTPTVNFVGTCLVYDETVNSSTSAIKTDFTDIQLFLGYQEILIFTAENIGGNANQTCRLYVNWYDVNV